MSWDSSRPWPVRGSLARHLGRLQQHLDAVGDQVREAVANAIGRTVAEAVGEVVYDALCPRPDSSSLESRGYPRYAGHSSRPRREWDEPAWRRETDSSSWRDAYAYDDDDESRNDEWEPESTSSPPDEW